MSLVWKEMLSRMAMLFSLSTAGKMAVPSIFVNASLTSVRMTTDFTCLFWSSQDLISLPFIWSEASALRKAQGRFLAAMPGLADDAVMIGVLPWAAIGNA